MLGILFLHSKEYKDIRRSAAALYFSPTPMLVIIAPSSNLIRCKVNGLAASGGGRPNVTKANRVNADSV